VISTAGGSALTPLLVSRADPIRSLTTFIYACNDINSISATSYPTGTDLLSNDTTNVTFI
jgi:hypothetical protein